MADETATHVRLKPEFRASYAGLDIGDRIGKVAWNVADVIAVDFAGKSERVYLLPDKVETIDV